MGNSCPFINEGMSIVALQFSEKRDYLTRRVLSGFLLLPALFAFGFTVSLFMFGNKAYKVLGHMPIYNHPDPKTLAFYERYEPVITGYGSLWLMSLISWLLLAIMTLYITRRKLLWQPVLLGTFGHTIALVIFAGSLMEWFAD